MEYKPATQQEVTDYFANHEDYLCMLLDYLGEQLDTSCAMVDILNITDFVIVPQAGPFPLYVKEAIEDQLHAPVWESVEEDVYYVRIFKLLWFVVLAAHEPHGNIFEVFSASDYESVVSQAQKIAEPYEEEINAYYYGWQNKKFLDNKQFARVESDVILERIEFDGDSQLIVEPIDFGGDMYAWVGRNESQQLFVVVTDYDGDWTVSVPNLTDARSVLSGIWN